MAVRNSMYWWVADRETRYYATPGRIRSSILPCRRHVEAAKKDFIVYLIDRVKPVTAYRLFIWAEVDKGRRCCEMKAFRREWKTVKNTERGRDYRRQGAENKASWIRTKTRFEKWLKTVVPNFIFCVIIPISKNN